MDYDKLFSPTAHKAALFLAIFLLAVPCVTFQIRFACVPGTGCPTTAPAPLPPLLALFYSFSFPQGWNVVLGIDFLFLALGLIPAYLLACGLAYFIGKYYAEGQWAMRKD